MPTGGHRHKFYWVSTHLICKKLASGSVVEEKVQNNDVELASFTDVNTDERTEPEVTESKFKTEVEEKVGMTMSNLGVLLMLILMKEQNQKSQSKFKTEVKENSPLTNC